MVTAQKTKQDVIRFYDQEASQYHAQYTDDLMDQEFYPANSIRLDLIIDRMKEMGAKRVLDVGCGTGQPTLRMLSEGFDVVGFDFSPNMIEGAKKALEDAGHDPNRVNVGDLETDSAMPQGDFDAIVATGVFPHNLDDVAAYANIKRRLPPGAIAFVEYRNALMSLFSMNKYSSSFFWEDLLRGEELPEPMKSDVLDFLAKKFNTDVVSIGKAREIEYSQILAKFHNPLTLDEELGNNGLSLSDVHYYHFHAAPPHLEGKHREGFWKKSLKMERINDWRGMFLCSAYVAEIVNSIGIIR